MDHPGEPAGRRAFSATDAAFSGFALARRDGGSIVAWAILALIFGVVIFAMTAASMAPLLQAISSGAPLDAAQNSAFSARMAPANGVSLLLSMVFYPVLLAAVYRAVLRPRPGFGHLRLGKAELLQFLALTVVGVAIFAAYLGGLLVCLIVSAVVVGTVSQGAGVLVGVVLALGVLCGLLFLAVRLSFVGPATFDRNTLRLGEAWAMTRGRFWPLLGAYMLAWVLAMLVVVAAFVVVGIVGAALVIGLHMPLPSAGASALQPGPVQGPLIGVALLYLAVMSLVNGLIYAVMFAPAAHAYRQVVGAAELDVFGPDRSHTFGTAAAPAPPPPDTEYPITPPRPSPPDAL